MSLCLSYFDLYQSHFRELLSCSWKPNWLFCYQTCRYTQRSHMLQNFLPRAGYFVRSLYLSMSRITGKIELDKAIWVKLYYL